MEWREKKGGRAPCTGNPGIVAKHNTAQFLQATVNLFLTYQLCIRSKMTIVCPRNPWSFEVESLEAMNKEKKPNVTTEKSN